MNCREIGIVELSICRLLCNSNRKKESDDKLDSRKWNLIKNKRFAYCLNISFCLVGRGIAR